MAAVITKGESFEDQGVTLMARIVGNAATNITQATLTSITYTVVDKADPTTLIVSGSAVTISSSVFDTLQTDARWTADSTGYNFRHTVAASVISTGERTYRIEYKFTPTSGEVFYAVFEITARQIYGS